MGLSPFVELIRMCRMGTVFPFLVESGDGFLEAFVGLHPHDDGLLCEGLTFEHGDYLQKLLRLWM